MRRILTCLSGCVCSLLLSGFYAMPGYSKAVPTLSLEAEVTDNSASAQGPFDDKDPQVPGRSNSGGTIPSRILCADTSSSEVVQEVCGAAYVFNGVRYDSSGLYSQVYPNAAGCDSTVYLDLTLHAMEQPIITVHVFELSTVQSYQTYQWLRNGEVMPGETNRAYTVVAGGAYSVVVTNENGCIDTSEKYKVIEDGIGICQPLKSQINIYPNPIFQQLNITTPIPVTIQIHALDGRILYQEEKAQHVDMEHWPRGAYFVRIMDGKGNLIKVERVIKN